MPNDYLESEIFMNLMHPFQLESGPIDPLERQSAATRNWLLDTADSTLERALPHMRHIVQEEASRQANQAVEPVVETHVSEAAQPDNGADDGFLNLNAARDTVDAAYIEYIADTEPPFNKSDGHDYELSA
jgi:hypothetical protein